MKNDRYFPLEICFWAGDNLSVMMYQTGGVQLVGIYVLLLLSLIHISEPTRH